jgi:hypothetical protein
MSENNFSKETFWSLLSKNNGIVIPIIQRAYTQGGRGDDKSVAEKGEKFLQCLVDALIGEKDKRIELDFIYGTTEEGGKIQPLDGQQRLTTLFLLHWYVAQKESRLEEAEVTIKKFSYETRASSRYFCGRLCEFLMPASDSRSLQEIIEDQGWFVLSWKNDPSVLSMLGMLGKIHNKLKDVATEASLWDKLISVPEKAPITFFYTPLEAFNLTDELYIKMNARGKELTPFEKFKASIEKKIDDNFWDKNKKSVSDTFGVLMDTKWTDLFWQFRDENHRIDRYVLRFFSAVLIGYYAGQQPDKATRLFNAPESITLGDLDQGSYDCLYETLNLFYAAWDSRKEVKINSAHFWWGDKEQELKAFGDFFKLFTAHNADNGKMTWQQLALFYGFTVFLKNNSDIDAAKFSDWLRIVRNLITNETINTKETFLSAKKRFDEIAEKSGDIYGRLATETDITGFANEQMKEEIQKAKIYQNSPDAKPIIQGIEEYNFCRGRVSFILNCLDIADSVPDPTRLKKMQTVVSDYLNNADISNDFRRALLTISDNCYYEFSQPYCLITSNKDKNRADIRNFSFAPSGKKYLKPLLLKLFDETIENIINAFTFPDDMPEWKRLLIKDKEGWMKREESYYKYLKIEGNHAYLLRTRWAFVNIIEIKTTSPASVESIPRQEVDSGGAG